MKKTLNRIIFFGNERLASGVTTTAPVLRGLIDAGYDIACLVIAQQTVAATRKTRPPEIVQVANSHHIPVLTPTQLGHISTKLASYQADIGVLVAYGKIVPASIIALFPRGIVNIHPSLLPKHRGPTPIESVILSGEQETGVSLMQLAIGMDSGPLYAQRHLPLQGNESKAELATLLLNTGKTMLLDKLPDILDGSLLPQPQDHTQATYDKLLTKELSQLDWHKPALQLAREVRAYAGWPRSRTNLKGQEVIITQAHARTGDGTTGSLLQTNRELGFYTTDGVLMIDALLLPGKKEMSAQAFLAGYLRRSNIN